MPSERRLHPVAIAFDLGRQIGALALPFLLLLVGARSGNIGSDVIAIVLLVPYTLVAIGRYLSFTYRYEALDFVVRSGLIFRNERHIPYGRIQNLDAVQNVLHRLFGVVEVRVQTGSGKEAEATLSAVPLAAFEEMRARVFERRGALAADGQAGAVASPAGRAEAPVPARPILALPVGELILHGAIENRGFIVIAGAIGLLWQVAGDAIDRIAGDESAMRGVARDLASAFGGVHPSFRTALAVAALVVGVLVLSRLISVAWAVVRLYGFTLARAGEDLRTSYGLLTRVAATVPLRRIQTLTIRQSLLHRAAGRASIHVSTAGGAGAEARHTHREWLAPIVRQSAITALLEDVLPGVDIAAVDWQRVHPRALGRAFRKRLVLAAVVAAFAWWFAGAIGLAVAAPIAIAWAGVSARLYVSHLSWAVSADAVLFRWGAFARYLTVARFAKIQGVELLESPFDRRASMMRLRVDTAGAAQAFRVEVPYLPADRALALGRALAMKASGTVFRW